jgi:hypothetical protein
LKVGNIPACVRVGFALHRLSRSLDHFRWRIVKANTSYTAASAGPQYHQFLMPGSP